VRMTSNSMLDCRKTTARLSFLSHSLLSSAFSVVSSSSSSAGAAAAPSAGYSTGGAAVTVVVVVVNTGHLLIPLTRFHKS
jgi:hypothetical protein